MTLEEAIKKIQPLDEEAMEYTRARWNTLGKPLHSLGRLEEMVTQFAGIYRDKKPHLGKKQLLLWRRITVVVARGSYPDRTRSNKNSNRKYDKA